MVFGDYIFSQRCDTKFNCRDSSDEFHCHYVIFQTLYAKEIAPMDKDSNDLKIFMNVSILDIPYIDTYEMKFTVSFILRLRWQDFRLVFLNLNENHDLNLIRKEDKDALWTPEIRVMNLLGQSDIVFDDRTMSKLIRLSLPYNETKDHAAEGKLPFPVFVQVYPIHILCIKFFSSIHIPW